MLEALHDSGYGASPWVLAYILMVTCKISWRRCLILVCLFLRLSGVPNTSSGNSKGNAYCCLLGLHYLGILDDELAWRILVLGDDNALFIARNKVRQEDIAPAMVRAYAEMGQVAEVLVSLDPLAVTYCSGRFYLAEQLQRVWAPKAGRSLAKMGWQLRSPLHPDVWLAATAASWIHDVAHVPVLRAAAIAMRRWSTPQLAKGIRLHGDQRPHVEYPHTMPLEGLLEFAALYDLAPSEVLDAEAYILRAERGAVLDHWVIHKICAADIPAKKPSPTATYNTPGHPTWAPAQLPSLSEFPWEDILQCDDKWRQMRLDSVLKSLRANTAQALRIAATFHIAGREGPALVRPSTSQNEEPCTVQPARQSLYPPYIPHTSSSSSA
jgi:hypothetical protein